MQGKYAKQDKLEDVKDYFESMNAHSGQPIQDDAYYLAQQIKSNNQSRIGRLKASFVEPIDKSSILEIGYEYNYTAIDSRRSVWDTNEEVVVDSLGIDYSYFFESNRVGLNYQMEQNKRFKYTLGFAVQPLLLQGHMIDVDTLIQHRNVNIIPSAGLRFRISE